MMATFQYHCPENLEEALSLKTRLNGVSYFFAGATDLLIQLRRGEIKADHLIDLKKIKHLREISFDEKEISIGAAVTIAEIIANGKFKNSLKVLTAAGKELGTSPLRNRATIGGNLVTASSAADMIAVLLALDTTVEIANLKEVKRIKLCEFFTGPKLNVLKADEILTKILIDQHYLEGEGSYRKKKRVKGADLSQVNICMFVSVPHQIFNVSLGALGPVCILLNLKQYLAPLALDYEKTKELLLAKVAQTIAPRSDQRASLAYRQQICANYFQAMIDDFKQGGIFDA